MDLGTAHILHSSSENSEVCVNINAAKGKERAKHIRNWEN